MKMLSRFVGRNRPQHTARNEGRARQSVKRRSMALEQLEERTLLAIAAGPNVNISQFPGNQAEATIAIDRTNTDNLFAASNTEFGNGIFAAVSTDAGITWGAQNIADGTDGLPVACCDPSAVFDEFGNLFLTYLSTGINRIVVLNSVDGGVSFNTVGQLGFFADQPTVTAAAAQGSLWLTWEQGGAVRTAGAPVTGLGVVGPFGAQLTVPGSNGGSFGDIAIGPVGQVMVTYQIPAFGEGPAQIFTNVDPDGLGPAPFGSATLATDTNVGGFDFIPAQFGRAIDAEAGLAYDRTGGLNDGRAYLVYTDELVDESDDTDIFVRFSDDDGATWSVPVKVNDDTSANSQFLPRLALDQTTGVIAVTWHDARNDDGLFGAGDTNGIANDDTQFFASASSDGGATFEPNVQISAGTSNAESALSGVDYGDYSGLDFFQGLIYPAWADNSDSLGDNPTAPEFDIFTAQLTFVDTMGPFVVNASTGVTAFQTDFEIGAAGFTTTGAWHQSTGRGNDPGHSPTNSFYFGQGEGPTGGGTYMNNSNGSLLSPAIDLTGITGNVTLEFRHLLESEPGFDQASVDILVGAAVTTVASNSAGAVGNLPDSTGGAFVPERVDISQFAGQSIRVRFNFRSDVSIVAEGWYVDDVTIVAALTGPAGPVGPVLNGPVAQVEFTFNEALTASSFDLADVTAFTVTDTLGATTNLIPSLTGFAFPTSNVLRVFFVPQGPAGDYSITIGPAITDLAGNPMNQDMDGTNGETPADQFTTVFSISTLFVTSVQITATSIVVNFSKDVEPSTRTSDANGDCNGGAVADNIFVEASGGDFAFAGDANNTITDVCLPTTSSIAAAQRNQIIVNFGGPVPTDLYRLHLVSGGLTDVIPMLNALDGEFPGSGAPFSPFPSGEGVVGGDFLYRFVNGDAPVRATTAEPLAPSTVVGDPVIIPASFENASNTSIAVDPLDPLRMVATWTEHDPSTNPVTVQIQSAVSQNGGQTWTTFFTPPNIFNPATTNPTVQYPEATDASVAFDRSQNFYILNSQHTADFSQGALVLQKYNLSGATPIQTIFDRVLYQWVAERALNPTLIVDTTEPTFTDPETGVTQVNPWSGNVYVSWNTQNTNQSNVRNPNPNVILVSVSSDGGSTFGPAIPANDGSFCIYNAVAAPVPPQDVQDSNCGINNTDGEFDTTPRLVVSQGRPATPSDAGVPGGQLSIVWDDFGSGRRSNPAFDNIVADRIPDGGLGFSFTGTGGTIFDAVDPGGSQPHIPSSTAFRINVTVNDPRFVSLSDLDVTVNMTHNALAEVSLVLIPPAQSGRPSIVLAPNRTNAANASNNNVGLSGTSLGVLNGFDVGATFDQDAARSIFVGASPYIGHFRPQGGDLDVYNGMDMADVNGTWTLQVTDFRASNVTAPPFPFLDDWSISFSSGMTTGADVTVATSSARGAANGPYPRRVPASPQRGIAPLPVLASDNTLGSFSPYQGRLYLVYTDIPDVTGQPNDSDVFIVASDDGGNTWNALGGFFFGGITLNDDNILDGTTGVRSQFLPTVAVDQSTGTVVTAWLDARNDAANARVATYMSSSNDGGQTWSKNVFLNRKHTATDCYEQFLGQDCITTNEDRVYGPIPDNQSNGNSARDQTFNFGDNLGLSVSGGVVTAVWPGNENVAPQVGTETPDCCTTNVFVGHARVAAGPRVADSTMGWVDSPAGSFDVTFDRFVSPASFTADPGMPGSVVFAADFEAANDTITFDGFYGFTFDNSGFDGTVGTLDDGLWHRSTGRAADLGHSSSSSMYFGQGEVATGGGDYDTGSRTSGRLISPLIDLTAVNANSIVQLTFNYFLETEAFAGFDRANVNVVVASATTVASNTINLLDPSLAFQSVTIDISQFIGQQVELEFSFDSVDAVANFFEGWYVDDVVVTDLGVPPDVQVFHRDVFGNDTVVPVTGVIPISCTVVGCDQYQVNFQPQTDTGTYFYAVGPSIQDRIRSVSGTIVPGSTISQAAVPPEAPKLTVDAPAVFVVGLTPSTITIAGAPANTIISDVNITLTVEHTCDNYDLLLWLVHPDGTRALLDYGFPFAQGPCTVNSYTNTTFDDQAATFTFATPRPFTGSFLPIGPLFGQNNLSALNGKAVNGDYTLEVWDIFPIDTGRVVSWSLDIQTGVAVSSVRPGNFMDQNGNGVTREPAPLTVPPLFSSIARDNHDAYLAPRSFDDTGTLPLMVTGPRVAPTPEAKTIGSEFAATAVPLPIVNGGIRTQAAAVAIADNATTFSTIVVPDSFNVSDLNVTLNISHAQAADLDIVLRHVPSNKAVTLVSDVTAGGANFTNTTFDDEGGVRIGNALNVAPYSGFFIPPNLLNLFDGLNAQGTWRLEITDDTAGVGGMLNSWSLDFGTESEFVITDHFPISDLDVMLDLSGVNLADLRVELTREDNLETIPRDPMRIVLFQPGDAAGATMSRTIFNDEAAAGLAAGAAPYRSTFRSRGLLASLDDPPGVPFSQSNINGVWSLRISDVSGPGGTAGTLNAWSLIVNPTLSFTNSILPLAIADNATSTSTINVPDSFTVSDLNVSITLDHPIDQDVDIRLIHVPTGTAVTLVTDVASGGMNFTDTTFDDQAGTGINAATNAAPYTGHFVPQQLLSIPAVPDFTSAPGPALPLADGATTVSTILVNDPNPITVRDLSVQLNIAHLAALDMDIVLRHVPSGRFVTLVTDVATGGSNFTGTTFDDEAPLDINSVAAVAPHTGFFIPEEALSTFDGIDARGAWRLEITDDTLNGIAGTLNSWTLHFGGFGGIDAQGLWRLDITDDTGNLIGGVLKSWTLDFGQEVQTSDLLALQGNANFIDIAFDRDVDPRTFTTVDVERIIGPAGPIGANPRTPIAFSTLDTTPSPLAIPDNDVLVTTIDVPIGFTIGDLDVLVDVTHADTSQLSFVLTAPDGVTRVNLIDNLPTVMPPLVPVPDLVNTILDDEATTVITGGTAPYTGRFRPFQANPGLRMFDGMNAEGTWTLEVTDEASGVVGTLNRWNLIFTKRSENFTTAPAAAIPDNGSTNSTVNVPASFPIHDIEVTLNITHPRLQDLAVTLVGPDGTTVPLVASMPATGANLVNTTLDDDALNVITVGDRNSSLGANPPQPCTGIVSDALVDRINCTTRFRPGLPAAGRLPTLSDFHGHNSQGVWTLQVRDTTASGAATQTLNSWTLSLTPSEFRVLPNPNGTDPDPQFPQTFRVYFPRQTLSGTYAISLGSNILSEEQLTDPRCFITGHPDFRNICGIDANRNAGLKALRRGDGVSNAPVQTVDLRPGTPDSRVDFQSTYRSSDVGDPMNGKPIPEPIGTAMRPVTSRIFVPDNVTIADLNIELTITQTQPPGQRPLMRDDDYDVFLISPAGTRLELFSDVGGAGVNFVQLFLNDEAVRCLKACNPVYVQDGSAPLSDDFRPENLKPPSPLLPETANGLKVFDGEQARGVWTLEIIDDTANGLSASLRNWNIEISGRTTGLGEHSADQIQTSFRLFTLDPADPRSSSAWTGVGPANDNGRNDDSARTGAIAVDPSDPSGNTVFVAGATGGVWKTTNFLTADPGGPTYVPLTDFAPTFGLHIGSIALFPRNNDPNQTIVYVATGEADQPFIGVGFLKSLDGGATWRLQDSFNNDENIPFVNRDHALVGSTAFKVVVDPTFPDGRVAYAALSGFNGGLYKTLDGGIHWTNTRPGQATDVVLDPVNTEVLYAAFQGQGVFISSDRASQWRGTAGTAGAPTVVFNAQVRDVDVPGISNGTAMPIGQPQDTPGGANGRISLAKPFLTRDAAIDRAYEGRVYAIVSTPAGGFDGAYMTSDFGANWTKLELGRADPTVCTAPPSPTNNETTNFDVNPFGLPGCGAGGQGNYDQAIIADPLNPNRFYVFGTGYPDAPAIGVDVSLTYDGHHYKLFDHNNADGGATVLDTVGGAVRKRTRDNGMVPPFCQPIACLNGFLDFGGDELTFAVTGENASRIGLYRGTLNNVASFENTGHETRWAPMLLDGPFLSVHEDYHDVATIVDPITGLTRLIMGTDGGVFTVLAESGYDANGRAKFSDYFTEAPPSPSIGNSIGADNGSRNGNLQTSQIYGGATQPNQIAAEIAQLFKGGGMFYGTFQDNGASKSDAQILQNGNIAWTSYFLPRGDAGFGMTAALADDDATLGDAYTYFWPCCGGNGSDVILLNGVPRVTGLDLDIPLLPAAAPVDIYISYRDAKELLFSGPTTGRLYKTDDAGRQWLEIGDPAVFSGLGATAAAFGAEQPDANPNDFIEADETIFVGLPNGRLFASVNEGGDNGQEWFDISSGLDGFTVEDIAPNIRQFSGEVYLVTTIGVFWMPEDPQPDARVCRFPGRNDIIPGGDFAVKSRLVRAICDVIQGGPAANVNNPWIDITGGLRTIEHTIFPGAWNGEGTLGSIVETLPVTFSSIKVDDRYQIPDPRFVPDPNLPPDDPANQAPRSPLVYVAGGNDGGGSGAGVFRTFDHGQTWRRFPDEQIDGAPIDGGYLPNANVSEIELSIGPYDFQTGLSDFSTSLDLLVAHTFGRGTFAIRSAPLIFTSAGGIVTNAPDLRAADDTGFFADDNITRNDGGPTAPLRLDGLTHRGATVRLLEDQNGILTEIGRGLADFFTGDWTVFVGDVDGDGVPDGETLDCGQHVIRAQAISASGTVGQVSDSLTVTVLNEPPVELAAPDLVTADDSVGPGGTNTDDITRIRTPSFAGSTFCGMSGKAVPQATIRLMVQDPTIPVGDPNRVVDPATGIVYRTVGFGTSVADGSWIATVSAQNALAGDPPVPYVFAVRAEDLAGNIGPFSPTIVVTIDSASPPPSFTAVIVDTGRSASDAITFDQTLVLTGAAEPLSTVTVRRGNLTLGTVVATGAGVFTFPNVGSLASLPEGTYIFTAQAQDLAGNTSPVSADFTVVIDTTVLPPSTPDLVVASDTGLSNSDNVTNDNTPTIVGTAEANAFVTLFSNVSGQLGTTLADATGMWTFTSPSLPDAVHDIRAQAEDVAGNVSALSGALSVTIDTVPPASPPSTPDLCSQPSAFCPERSDSGFFDNDNYTNDTTPSFSGTAEPNGAVTVFDFFNANLTTLGTAPVDAAGNWKFTSAQLLPGVHNVSARNTDVAGNVSPSSTALPFTIDTSVAPPSVPDLVAASDSGNSSTDNITNVRTPTFAGTGEANGRIEVFAGTTSLGTSPIGPAAPVLGSWTHTSTVTLADGVFSVTARVTDLAGNVSAPSGPLSMTIDGTPPLQPTTPDLKATSDSGISNVDNITNDNTPDFTGTAQVGTTVLIFDGGTQIGTTTPSATGVWNFAVGGAGSAVSSFADGVHPITARARDVAGNVSVASQVLNVTIDTVIATPLAPNLDASCDSFGPNGTNSDDVTNDDTPCFSETAEALSTVTVMDGTTPLGTTQANGAGQWNFTSGSLIDGQHQINVSAVDLAGNPSGTSPSLTITIDTLVNPPVITGITEDRGPSATDGITNDQMILINGVSEANSTVTVSRQGIGALAPSVNASGAGNWTYDNQAQTLAPGSYNFTATAIDRAGNVSATSAVFRVIVDITPPASVTTPSLDLADDTGVQGDLITNKRRPRMVGTTEANAQVTIFFNDFPVDSSDQNSVNAFCTRTPFGTGGAGPSGSYVAQFANPLADGPQTVRVCATDAAGNPAVSSAFMFVVDGTPPRVQAFEPTGTLTVSTSQIVVTFNKDALNATLLGDPAFAGSVNNRANFMLQGSGGDAMFDNGDPAPISLSTSDFLYDRGDPLVDRLTINIRGATGALAPLPNDTWRFTISGTTSLQDIAGNNIDGELPGSRGGQTTPFPSGNDVAGGNFVTTFQIAVPPPTIDPVAIVDGVRVPSIQLFGTKKVITRVSVQFSRPLDVMTARNPNNYAIIGSGRDHAFGTADDAIVQLATPAYDPNFNSRLVTLNALRGFATNTIFQLQVNDGITDPGGNHLDGNGDGVPGGRFVAFVGRGNTINFMDGDGSAVNISTGRAGAVDVVLGSKSDGRSIADGRTIRVDATTVTARTALTGRVAGGNGRATFDTIVGSNGINRAGFPICSGNATSCFEFQSVSSVVVDRVLETGGVARDGLSDGLAGLVEEIWARRR